MSEPITTTPGIPPLPGATKRPPGPHGLSPLGSAYAVGHDPMRFALNLWHRYGDVVRFRLLSWPAYALYHPDQVKQVLQENHRNYNKASFMMKANSSQRYCSRLRLKVFNSSFTRPVTSSTTN